MTNVIHAYTQKQALEDGVLIDAGEMARKIGFRYPMAITAAVWGKCVTVPDGVEGQDEEGRLWDILHKLLFAIRGGTNDTQVPFSLYVNNGNGPEPVSLKAICGPGDDPKPVITIMRPDED